MKIQLNADVGEGMANDAELMPFLSYANIACGGHAGSINTIKQTIQLAKEYGVKVGAHPSYPDTFNFGRQSMSMSLQDLEKTIIEQVDLFIEAAKVMEVLMNHIKLHGALYNDVFKDVKKTKWFLNFVSKQYKDVKVFVPVGVEKYVESSFRDMVMYEAFADRNYNNQLQLVSRSISNATIDNPDEVFKHVQGVFLDNKLTTVYGNVFNVEANTFCLHGDNPNVVAIAKKINQLEK